MSESALSTRPLYVADANPEAIRGKKVLVTGYGSQAHAHALNLKDSGVEVAVGLREGSSNRATAESVGLTVMNIAEGSAWADIVMMLIPDTDQGYVAAEEVVPHLVPGNALAFAHGFNIRFGLIEAPEGVDVIMIAPKGPGHLVRTSYESGGGIPMLIAVEQNATGNARELALAYADAIGGTRAGVIETTFTAETETDLFGEQAVLCGGLLGLILAGYEILTEEGGYEPEMGYFECFHEVKLIVDLLHEKGIGGMLYSISTTAEYGALSRMSRVIGPEVKEAMRQLLRDIQSGDFAEEWMAEYTSGGANFDEMRAAIAAHPIEAVGRELRGLMPWLDTEELSTVSGG